MIQYKQNLRIQRKEDNTLGLFSDYLEACRDNLCENEIDPCLFIGSSVLRIYHSYSFTNEVKKGNYIDTKEIEKRLYDFERFKAIYLIEERILLKYKNMTDVTSALVKDVLIFIDEQLHQSYIGVCEIINELRHHLSSHITGTIIPDTEERIISDLLDSIMNGILFCLKNGSAIDTSECRKVVNDAAHLICFFTKENFSFSRKQIFQYYLENVLSIPKSQCLCYNCHKTLFLDMPYCFNCYERNS